MNDYDNDGFSTLTLRVGADSLSAMAEGPVNLHHGDAVTVVLCFPAGVSDVEDILFSAFSTTRQPLCEIVGDDAVFALVPGYTDRAYANFTFLTVDSESVTDALEPGEYEDIRLYASVDGGRTFLDLAARLYPNPQLDTGAVPAEARDAYVLKAPLKAAVAAVKLMPTNDAAAREARFIALLNALTAATT